MARNRTIRAVALLLVLLTGSAHALTLDEARQQGRVGETLSGYVAARQQDEVTLALVSQRIAGENKLTTSDVARIAGEKLVSRASAGEYVRGINGQWLQK